MFLSIPSQIANHALHCPDAPCLTQLSSTRAPSTLTYAQLHHAATRLAATLQPDTTVAALAGNCNELIVLYLACARSHTTLVPVNASFPPGEICEVLTLVAPSRLYAQPDRMHVAQAACASCGLQQCAVLELRMPETGAATGAATPADPAREEGAGDLDFAWAVLFTSGTTSGRKRGVRRSQRGTICGAFLHQGVLGLRPEQVFLCTWPAHGVSTFFFSFACLYLGARVVLAPSDASAEFIARAYASQHVTLSTGPPAMFESIARLQPGPGAFPALQRILVSGTTFSARSKLLLSTRFAPAKVLQAYGSTECGIITCDSCGPAEAGDSVGWPLPGSPRVVLSPTHEVLVDAAQSPMFMLGYLDASEENDRATDGRGFFHTGDQGLWGHDGRLFLAGRTDDRICLSSGHDFFPQEVEVHLNAAGCGECFVFLAKTGQVEAVVAAPPAHGNGDPRGALVAKLEGVLREHVAEYKRPKRFIVVAGLDALETTSTGKVKRRCLRDVVGM
jgi:acyl-CoA synthetase (AMP-forming)/AMP-acid ligase II